MIIAGFVRLTAIRMKAIIKVWMFLTLTILEGILIITGLFCLRKGGPVILFLLLFLIVIDFINENVIVTHSMQWWKISSNVFYNAYSFLEILCWVFIYHHIYAKANIKGIIIFCGAFILIFSLLEVFFIYSPDVFHTLSYAGFSMFSLCFSGVYLLKINSMAYHSLHDDPIFWLCAGATCFNSVFLVNLSTMLDPIYWLHTQALQVFHILQSVALIIYYLFICIAFILFYCRHRQGIYRSL